MKKKIIICLFILVLAMTGCKKGESSKENDIVVNGDSVVIYFSATGTTKKIAERIADKLNSDIIEIIPKIKYTSDDLNYNSDCRANREQNDSSARPEIENKIDISKYNIVYLGYPIWWGTNPRIILTLLDTYDFTDKTIIPFCTSGSSSIDGSIRDLRNYDSKLHIKDGRRFSLNDDDNVIEQFINN